jgi:HAD superfamily hydrolase (TIGR01459 family)
LFEGLACVRLTGAAETALIRADFILCTGLFDDDAETAADYRPLLSKAVNLDLVMICANPDLTVVRGSTLISCAGAIAAEYEGLGGVVQYFGKPYPEIYDLCLSKWKDDAGPGGADVQLQGKQILSIGDSFRTDIAGARNMGFRSVLIADGIHSEEFGTEPGQLPTQEKIDTICRDCGYAPDAVMATLTW